jgi:hypothetical protein
MGAMHAVVATVKVTDVQQARDSLAGLRLDLVPRAPGFVSACWLEPIDGVGMSVIIFETKKDAENALAYPLPPIPGVTALTVEIREVYARA